jgi:hypothetical protein
LVRSIRTMAQTALSMVTVGVAVTEMDWSHIVFVSATAGIFCFLTCIATAVPEVEYQTSQLK